MEFHFQQALDSLERAASITGSANVSVEERKAAESVILNFLKSKDSIELSKFILEKTQSELLRYDAAQVLRDNLVASWNNINQTDFLKVLAQQLINLLFNSNMSYAVNRRLGSIISLAVKNQAIQQNGRERKELVQHLLTVTKVTRHHFIVATSILESLIDEHQFIASGLKTEHLFTFEEDFASKKNFENDELLLIFEGCLEYFNAYNGGNEEDLERILRLVEVILCSWSFININLPPRILSVLESDVFPVFKPPSAWERVVTNVAFENIFFDLHLKIRGNETLECKTMLFISQIFSMSGPLFPGKTARVGLLGRLFPKLIQLLQLPNKSGREVLGLSDIVRKVLLFHRLTTLTSLGNLLGTFLCTAGAFTCGTLRDMAAEEAERNMDDRIYREASTRLLEAWTNVLSRIEDAPNCVLEIASGVFTTYLYGKLSPPIGYRLPISLDDDDEEEEISSDDLRFQDQLQSLGLFGRAVIEQSIELVTTVLSQLILQFQSLVSGNGGSPVEIYEDIHWILLIIGHLLAYDVQGETNLIPSELVHYSLKYGGEPKICTNAIECAANLIPLPDGKIDPIVKLFCMILSLSELERRLLEAGHRQHLSPEVSKNVVWILGRVVGVYVLYNEYRYAEMSPAFQAVWRKDPQISNLIFDICLMRVRNHLEQPGEVGVQIEAVNLLASLTNSEEKTSRALGSSQFLPLVELIKSVGPNKRDLPGDVFQKAVKSLMIVGNRSPGQYWDQILSPLCLRISNFFTISPTDTHRADAKLELIYLLSGFTGIVSSATHPVAVDLFRRILPLRGNVASILSAYANYTDIVQLCLLFVTEMGDRILNLLPTELAIQIYDEALAVTKAYVHHAYGRVSTEKDKEDDSIQDLSLLFDMMTSLLAKDLFDLSSGDVLGGPMVSGASKSISCLSTILPLLTKDLFQYPNLSDKYFRLISYFAELEPGILLHLDTHIFNYLMETVSLALKTSNADNFSHCCEFIGCLGSHISRNNLHQTEASELIKPFLRVYLHMALTMTISKDSLTAISGALWALINAFKEAYNALAIEIISSSTNQTEELQRAFEELNPSLDGERTSRLFRQRLEKFIHTARNCLDA